MSKYRRLSEHLERLARKGHSQWKATFQEIEKVLDSQLPKSAYEYQAWWANQAGNGHSQTAGWKSVGWRTEDLDIQGQRVTFVHRGATPDVLAPGELTIAQAKAGLAAYFHVAPEMIEITIKG